MAGEAGHAVRDDGLSWPLGAERRWGKSLRRIDIISSDWYHL